MPCLYALLKVERKATSDQIRKAFYALARKVHPDKNPGNLSAAADFRALARAYEILSDRRRRSRYDRAGSIVSDGDAAAFEAAYERYRSISVTADDIEEFKDGYKRSASELKDVLAYVRENEGDLSRILESIIGACNDDVIRFTQMVAEAFDRKDLPKKWRRTYARSAACVLTVEELDEEAVDLCHESDSGSEDEDEHEEKQEEDISSEASMDADGEPTHHPLVGQKIHARFGDVWYNGTVTELEGSHFVADFSDGTSEKIKMGAVGYWATGHLAAGQEDAGCEGDAQTPDGSVGAETEAGGLCAMLSARQAQRAKGLKAFESRWARRLGKGEAMEDTGDGKCSPSPPKRLKKSKTPKRRPQRKAKCEQVTPLNTSSIGSGSKLLAMFEEKQKKRAGGFDAFAAKWEAISAHETASGTKTYAWDGSKASHGRESCQQTKKESSRRRISKRKAQ